MPQSRNVIKSRAWYGIEINIAFRFFVPIILKLFVPFSVYNLFGLSVSLNVFETLYIVVFWVVLCSILAVDSNPEDHSL